MGGGLESLIEVGPEVFQGFNAYAEAEHAGRKVLLAGDAGATLDGGFDGAEAGGGLDEAQVCGDGVCRGCGVFGDV